MGWSSPDSWLTRLFSGDPWMILFSFLVTLSLPALLHWYFYTTSPHSTQTPTVLLVGPSGSGKTSLVSLLQKRRRRQPLTKGSHDEDDEKDGSTTTPTTTTQASPTRVSQIASTNTVILPASIPLGSNKYRSANDFEVANASHKATKYEIVDTPGHGKLRTEHAFTQFGKNPAVRGVIFMVDSAALDAADGDAGEEATRDAAVYLHDILLTLQQQRKKNKTKAKTDVPVLIAANKQDLFTALPPSTIRSKLQDEIEKVRKSRARAVRSVDQDPDRDGDEDDEDGVLGGAGEEKFSFKLMEEEYEIVVSVAGGSVRGGDGGGVGEGDTTGVRAWEEWIGARL